MVECPLRLPAGELLDFFITSQESFDLALFGSDPLFVGDNLCGGADLVDEFLGQLADGNFVLCGDVDFFPDGVFAFCDGDESLCGVLDVDEVAGGGE